MILPRSNNLSRRVTSWLGTVRESTAKLAKPLIATSLLVTGATLGVRFLGLMESAELAAYDQLIQLQPREQADQRLLVVGITETDLQTLEEWPISDRTLANALTNLEQYQPQSIAVDIFRDFPHEPGTAALQQYLRDYPHTLIICKISAANDLGTPPPPDISPDQVGFADLVIDPGGILRRSLLMAGIPEPATPFPKQHLCNEPGQVLLSLSFRAAMQYLDAKGIEADFTADQQLRFGTTIIPQIRPGMGGYQRADTKGYQLMLNYRAEKQAVPEVSLMEIINDTVDPELIRDRIVFIGYTTPQAKDDFYTPYSISRDDDQKMPGVIVHAQSTSQLISTVLDNRPLIWSWSSPGEIGWILAWSFLGGFLGWYLRHPVTFVLVSLAGCGSLYSLCLLVFTQGGWIPLVPPTVAFMGTALGIVLLDRFNHSPYGQQVYQKVKNFLHLEIDIDEDRLEKQVSEITTSDYFRDLQTQVQNLRNRPHKAAKKPQTPSGAHSDTPEWPRSQPTHTWEHLRDGTGDLSHNLDQLLYPETSRPSDPPVDPQPPRSAPSSPESPDIDSTYELDFLQHLNQEAQQIKRNLAAEHPSRDNGADGGARSNSPSPPTNAVQSETTMALPSRYEPFILDGRFCHYTDTSVATQDYIDYLDREIAALKAHLRAVEASDRP